MHISYVSIFPEIFEGFLNTSLIKKAVDKKLLKFTTLTPRVFCPDRHQQVDDIIYGGGAGLLMKAKPAIDSVEHLLKLHKLSNKSKRKFRIIFVSPSTEIFTQKTAHTLTENQHLIFVCARYEGIDHRFEEYMMDKYPEHFSKISLGQFVTLGGEMPAMVMTEAVTRLLPGVIKEEESWQFESYSLDHEMKNIEYPQYTRPDDVYGYTVPEILISGHHKNINDWRNENMGTIWN